MSSVVQKILLFGAQGMLGNQFFQDHSDVFEIIPLARFNVDLEDSAAIEEAFEKFTPDAVVNTAAFTIVDKAEDAFWKNSMEKVNVQAVETMAKCCQQKKIPFLHISTDYVFSGKEGESFVEDDKKNPCNAYGKSKSEGEDAALKYNQTRIVRTAWLSGEFGHNFVYQMVHNAKTRPEIFVVEKEWGNPTFCTDVSVILKTMLEHPEQYAKGIYHAVSEGSCSRMELVEKICEILDLHPEIQKVLPSFFARPAKRPISSVLKNTKLPALPHWTESLEKFLATEKRKLQEKREMEEKKRRRNEKK